jgi:23S rRNA (pseudouridine1915-N3)-methyltransferase
MTTVSASRTQKNAVAVTKASRCMMLLIVSGMIMIASIDGCWGMIALVIPASRRSSQFCGSFLPCSSSSCRYQVAASGLLLQRPGSFTSLLSGQQRSTNCGQRKKHSSQNCHLCMGLQVKIRMVGREKSGTHDQWIQQACGMYTTRLKSAQIQVGTEWHKSNDALMKGVTGDVQKGNSVVLLDPMGKMPTSEQFADQMYEWLAQGGSRLVFVIGGAEGLPWELKTGSAVGLKRTLPLLSLSKLTFTHQFARLLLVEQIYRASEIRKGSNYHK